MARAVRGASGMVTTLPPSRVMTLAQVQGIGLAGQAAVPGQEPGEGEPLGLSKRGLDRGKDSGRGGGGHREPPGSAETRGLGQPQAPATNEDPSVDRNHAPDQLRSAHDDDHHQVTGTAPYRRSARLRSGEARRAVECRSSSCALQSQASTSQLRPCQTAAGFVRGFWDHHASETMRLLVFVGC